MQKLFFKDIDKVWFLVCWFKWLNIRNALWAQLPAFPVLFFFFSNPVQLFRESKGGTFSIFLSIKRQIDFVDLVAVSWRNYDLVDFVPACLNTVRR